MSVNNVLLQIVSDAAQRMLLLRKFVSVANAIFIAYIAPQRANEVMTGISVRGIKKSPLAQ